MFIVFQHPECQQHHIRFPLFSQYHKTVPEGFTHFFYPPCAIIWFHLKLAAPLRVIVTPRKSNEITISVCPTHGSAWGIAVVGIDGLFGKPMPNVRESMGAIGRYGPVEVLRSHAEHFHSNNTYQSACFCVCFCSVVVMCDKLASNQ